MAGKLSKNGKRFGLDLIRVILSFGIIVFHYQFFSHITATPVGFVPQKQPFYPLLYFFYNYGGEYRIPAFWCLSGFLYFWKYNGRIADRRVGATEFFILRLSRLYPVHLLTLMIVLILQVMYHRVNGGYFVFQDNELKHFLLQLFFASNWYGDEGGTSFNGPIWSLSVEVLIYFAFFFIARYGGKSIVTAVLVLAACAIIRIFHVFNPILHCMACFYAGGLAAHAYLKMDTEALCKRYNTLAVVLAVFIPLLAFMLRLYEHHVFSLIFVICYAPVIIFLSVQDVNVPRILQKIVETMGNMIYSTYLIHFPLQLSIALFCTYHGIRIPMYSPIFFVCYISAVFTFAYLLWYHFERPVQAFIRRWWKEVGSMRFGVRVASEKLPV